VALYLLTYRVDYSDGEDFANLIFTHTSIPSSARQDLFEEQDAVWKALRQYLHPNLRLSTIVDYMNEIADIIYSSYLKQQPLHLGAVNDLFYDVYQYLSWVVVEVKGVQDVSLRITRRIQPKKQTHDETWKPGDNDEYKDEGSGEVNSDGIRMSEFQRGRRKKPLEQVSVDRPSTL
jgi:hypothetical protein